MRQLWGEYLFEVFTTLLDVFVVEFLQLLFLSRFKHQFDNCTCRIDCCDQIGEAC